MRSQKAGRSSGDRLVVMLPSVTTSSSTTSAPALRRSVRTLGHEVSRRPRARSASTRFHGPWQMEATGLPESTKSRTKLTAVGFMRSWSGLTVPPGSNSASYSSTDAAPTNRSTPKVPASSRSWSRAAISPSWIDSTSVRAPASSRAWRGCSSSTRSTPSAARIATRRPFNSPAMSAPRHRRVQDDLGPALVALVEVLVGLRCPVEGQLVAHDERGLGLARGDEVAQLPVVLLDRGLAAADVLALEPEHAVVEGELALLRQLVAGAGVLGYEDADVADLPGEAHRGDQPVHRQVGLLVPVGAVGPGTPRPPRPRPPPPPPLPRGRRCPPPAPSSRRGRPAPDRPSSRRWRSPRSTRPAAAGRGAGPPPSPCSPRGWSPRARPSAPPGRSRR